MSRTRTNRKSREAVTGGMTHPQIAEILGVSPQRVQQIERRALAKLRKQLEPLSERIRLILSGAACFAMSLARGADLPPIPADAPAPTFELKLAWDAPAAPVSGYYIYWGPATRTYTNRLPVIGTVITGVSSNTVTWTNNTTATIPGLSYDAESYYFAMTATNLLGLESEFSNEAVWLREEEPALTNVLVTVHAEILSAPAIGGPWGVHANLLVFQATNPPGSLFFRPGQMSITRSNF